MNPAGALQVLVDFIFTAYMAVVLARFLLQVVRADFYNPVSQFIVRATNPILTPLRRIVPGFGGYDIPSLVLLYTVAILKFITLAFILNYSFSWAFLPLIALKEIASLVLTFYMYAIFLSIILGFLNQGQHNPFSMLLHQITDPVLAPARKVLPPMGGMDLSPILVFLAINIIRIFFGL